MTRRRTWMQCTTRLVRRTSLSRRISTTRRKRKSETALVPGTVRGEWPLPRATRRGRLQTNVLRTGVETRRNLHMTECKTLIVVTSAGLEDRNPWIDFGVMVTTNPPRSASCLGWCTFSSSDRRVFSCPERAPPSITAVSPSRLAGAAVRRRTDSGVSCTNP
ncbi:hypothetical protein B0H12DRAFT_731138 [Mycena haematopus]|nr:hypothetical protein B0H12DRAFT_731138 [Mycena haematopus]